MAKSLQLKIALWVYLCAFWGAAAYAAETDLAKGIESIPFAAIKYTVMFSLIGGAANTLNKITKVDVLIKSVWLEVVKDMFCGLAAGMLVFLMVSWTPMPFTIQAALITLGGAGGSRVIDRGVEDGLFGWMADIFNRLRGAPPAPPTPREETPPP